MADYFKGIDISSYQPNINWSKIKEEKIEFCYIKSTEGVSYKQPLALAQANGAKSVNIPVGYYHFARPDKNTAIAEADFFASQLKTLPVAELMAVLDIETNKGNLSAAKLTQWIVDFVNRMKKNGHGNIMIYSYTPFVNQYINPHPDLAYCKFWVAHYTTAAVPKLPNKVFNTKWDIWQYTGSGTLKGVIGTNVDINKCANLPIFFPSIPSV